MQKISRFFFAVVLLSGVAVSQRNESSRVAITPPMGWNSWDSFGRTINEKEVRGTAEKVAKDLKSSGWQYIVIDEGWYISNPLEQDATRYRFTMTEDGRFIPDPARFPSSAGNSGFKPLADYVHSLGLKFGIHILRGIPRDSARPARRQARRNPSRRGAPLFHRCRSRAARSDAAARRCWRTCGSRCRCSAESRADTG